jgi:hypothetical protein
MRGRERETGKYKDSEKKQTRKRRPIRHQLIPMVGTGALPEVFTTNNSYRRRHVRMIQLEFK